MGNITSVSYNGTLVASYEYDALGQLIRENNVSADTTYLFTYDKAGNILTKHQYAYSTDTTANLLNTTGQVTSYTYGNSTWGDLLTKHGSTSISYDEIGNPLNWRGYINLTWDKRSLTSLDFNYGSGVTFDMSFEYNSDGIRTQKTVIDPLTSDNYTVKYVLDGSKILRETRINNTTGAVVYTMDFMYDDSGVAGFIYNGTSYYYIKNLQGDVLYICNASGNIVVAYTYDAWGNILSTTGSMVGTIGKYNPFRYRGYYYDSEIALYYLNSRFYDPQIGRFINADGIVGANGGIVGYNMFAYCNNNPVVFDDMSGNVRSFACNISIVGFGCKISDEKTKNIFDYIKDGLEPAWGTYTYGLATSGTIGFWCFGIQGGLSSDLDGNMALQFTVSANVSASETLGYGWSGTQYSMVTNAPDITYLNDTGYQIGGAYGALVDSVPVYGSADVNIIPSNGQTYYGVTTYGGFGSPGAEVHAGWSETFTVGLVNVWETWSSLYEALEACFE